jgi:hypothetical protein
VIFHRWKVKEKQVQKQIQKQIQKQKQKQMQMQMQIQKQGVHDKTGEIILLTRNGSEGINHYSD